MKKRRTDISGKDSNPIFNVNKFNFPINDQSNLETTRIFVICNFLISIVSSFSSQRMERNYS